MTTADMLARLAALQALETCTSANDYETDCAIRRTLELIDDLKARLKKLDISGGSSVTLLDRIRLFDAGRP